jgi:hypothetical protein
MLDNKRRSRNVRPTARNLSGFSEGRRAREHTTKALSAFAASLKERRPANDEIDRDVGEHDALGSTEPLEAISTERRA